MLSTTEFAWQIMNLANYEPEAGGVIGNNVSN
jgi:hypothetical protein